MTYCLLYCNEVKGVVTVGPRWSATWQQRKIERPTHGKYDCALSVEMYISVYSIFGYTLDFGQCVYDAI